MRRLSLLGGVSVGAIGFCSTAHGIVQPYFMQVPISSAALAADPSLANYTSWDLRVAVSGIPSERFTVASLYGPLSTGTYYSPVGGGDLPVVPVTPNLAFDTYVTIPGYQPGANPNLIGIPGKADGYGTGPADFPRAGGQQSMLSATWGSLDINSGNGDFAIARLTVSKTAVGSATGFVMSNVNLTAQLGFNLSFANGMVAANGGSFALLGDANRDNAVNTADFTAMGQGFNRPGATWAQGDFNGDGVTNALDFNALATQFGANAPALGTLVPEPTAFGLLAIVALLPRRRR